MLSEHRIHLHLYGIRNCDTCRSVQRWLKTRNVPFTFHDFRADGLDEETLDSWLASSHAPYLINRQSLTWRRLSETERRSAEEDPGAVLLSHPTLIKRPVITDGESVLDVGFDPESLEDYI